MKTVFNVSKVKDRDGNIFTSNPVSTLVRSPVKFKRYYYPEDCCCNICACMDCCFFKRCACCVICKIC